MKKTNLLKKVIVSICIVVIVVTGIMVYMSSKHKTKIAISVDEKENTYKITTDEQYTTLRDDGGSHINVYYLIDFKNNVIEKYEDKYVGFKGYEYKDKKITEKEIDVPSSENLKLIIEKLLKEEDIKEQDNYCPYKIQYGDTEKDIYNLESIKILEDSINKILEKDV